MNDTHGVCLFGTVMFLNISTSFWRCLVILLISSFLMQPLFASAEEVSDEIVATELPVELEAPSEPSNQSEIVDLGNAEQVPVNTNTTDVTAETSLPEETPLGIDAAETDILNEETAEEVTEQIAPIEIQDQPDSSEFLNETIVTTTSTDALQGDQAVTLDILVASSTGQPETTQTSTTSPADSSEDSITSSTQNSDLVEEEVDLDETAVTNSNSNTQQPDVDVIEEQNSTENDYIASTSSTTATSSQQSVDETDEENSSESASTTQPTAVVVEHSAEFAFDQNECTRVENGSYYCQKADTNQTEKDSLFAAPDADGDLEIYVRRNGVETKVTSNLVDDASPFYDKTSDTIVWHRLVDDRYQIIAFDIDKGNETQITNTRVNNMEPSAAGDVMVWQRWVDGNWEIIMNKAGEEVQLTSSVEHDIAPSVQGSLVIWNVRSSDGEHSLMTYDLVTGVYNEISDTDGVSVSNPRMVVVYDAIYENGDTVVKGFDLQTGQVITLGSTPSEVPDTLPTPDATGEIRALLPSSSSKPQQESLDIEPEPEQEPDEEPEADTDLNLASSTSSVESEAAEFEIPDLDLRVATDSVPVSVDRASTTDLVIPERPIATTSSSTQS